MTKIELVLTHGSITIIDGNFLFTAHTDNMCFMTFEQSIKNVDLKMFINNLYDLITNN